MGSIILYKTFLPFSHLPPRIYYLKTIIVIIVYYLTLFLFKTDLYSFDLEN